MMLMVIHSLTKYSGYVLTTMHRFGIINIQTPRPRSNARRGFAFLGYN
jgi:hypothetical protein